jgi:hypothetical protein
MDIITMIEKMEIIFTMKKIMDSKNIKIIIDLTL